jgi:hypothetical protein
LLVLTPALLLGGCFGNFGNSEPAQDARLIVAAVTPVVQSAGSAGASPATVASLAANLATMRGEASTMATEYAPGLLDVQEFFDAAQDLLRTLSGLNGLPPASVGVVDAAIALLPNFGAIAERQTNLPARMTPQQARLVLQNGQATATVTAPGPAPAVASPPPPPAVATPVAAAAPRGGRFHLSMNDFDGKVHYEFWDNGRVVETGNVATLSVLEARYSAFKQQRLQQAP